MIAEKERYEVHSNLGGERVEMGVDETALGHIMEILTKLYSDPELAVIREMSTNAYDAHIEAKQLRPIEVQTPTSLSPFLVIQDWGVGMSAEDIRAIYSRYGASTKRNTNDQVGCLGLGCKSPLAYAPQFTIASVKDGERIAVAVSRDEDGSGSMTIVEQCSDNGPEGTTITIPAQRGNFLERKAEDFFRYWREGSVLLNGVEPTRIEGLKITDDITLVEDAGYHNGPSSVVVMGNVAYPWLDTDGLGVEVPRNSRLVARVPIGSVNFAPSREALMDTKTTRATLDKVWREFEAGKTDAVQTAVAEAKTAVEAVELAGQWAQRLRLHQSVTLTWQGKRLPTAYEPRRARDGSKGVMTLAQANSHSKASNSLVSSHHVEAWPRTLWVRGYEPGTFVASHKRKLEAYVYDKQLSVRYFVMLRDAKFEHDFIADSMIVDWETIRQIKLEGPPSQRNGYRPVHPPGSYDTYVDGEYKRLKGDELNTKGLVFWHHGNQYAGRRLAARLDLHFPKYTLVCLPANRIDKFCRIVKSAKRADEAIEAAYKAFMEALTDEQKAGMAMADSGWASSVQDLDPEAILDPELQSKIRYARMDVSKLIAKRNSFQAYRSAYNAGRGKSPLAKYPLADSRYGRGQKKHVTLYINAVYTAEQESANA